MKPKHCKVLLVDDHQFVLDGLRLILENATSIRVIAEALNGKIAIECIKEQKPDVILMDLNMPEMDGLQASKLISKDYPQIKILILSMLADRKLVEELSKQANIKGYMLKNSGQSEIIEAITKIHAGEIYFDQHVMKLMISRENKVERKVSIFPSLSRREKEILQLIISENTSSEISEKLFIGLGTVESHRRNMIRKLGVRNTAGLVAAAYEYNLLEISK